MQFYNHRFILLLAGILLSLPLSAQSYLVRDIRSFGAVGNGRTNDHAAFEAAAAFFNARGGQGKLRIPPGTYLVGKQVVQRGAARVFNWDGQNVLHLKGVRNFSIEGSAGAVLKYASGLRYGSFNPQTGQARTAPGFFIDVNHAASAGYAIFLDAANGVTIKGLELDGNSAGLRLGGSFGDVGRQLPHSGVFVQNSKNVTLQNIRAHHFGLDGACVANIKSATPDNIRLLDCVFEYNARQGFSWIGGRGLYARNCKFNHTGKGAFTSPPSAGMDIEAEYGPIRDGVFEDCEFSDATGCCVVADSGDSGYCTFTNCTFQSSTSWAIWVNKPGFKFTGCTIYGPIVHGYDANTTAEATVFERCHIEDRPYKGKLFGETYLIESNSRRRLTFKDCTITANTKKLFWLAAPQQWAAAEKYQLVGNVFTVRNTNLGVGDFVGRLVSAYLKDNKFVFKNKNAKKYFINDCCGEPNVKVGNNRTVVE